MLVHVLYGALREPTACSCTCCTGPWVSQQHACAHAVRGLEWVHSMLVLYGALSESTACSCTCCTRLVTGPWGSPQHARAVRGLEWVHCMLVHVLHGSLREPAACSCTCCNHCWQHDNRGEREPWWWSLEIFLFVFILWLRRRGDDFSFSSPFYFLSIEFSCIFFLFYKIRQFYVYYYCILIR